MVKTDMAINMKESSLVESFMVLGHSLIQMGIDTQASLKMADFKVMVSFIIKMEVCTKVGGHSIKKTDLVF